MRRVGSIVRMTRPSKVCKTLETGIILESYKTGEGILLESGEYIRTPLNGIPLKFDIIDEFSEFSNYEFKNITTVYSEYYKGIFQNLFDRYHVSSSIHPRYK